MKKKKWKKIKKKMKKLEKALRLGDDSAVSTVVFDWDEYDEVIERYMDLYGEVFEESYD